MNYAAHYERLIERARDRVLTGYVERHHVVPRCMGGGNERENLVSLTPEEHFVAHQLLVKLHPLKVGLVRAANLMRRKATGSRAYGWLRRRIARLMVGNTNRLGTKHSPEVRARMSLSRTGRKHSEEAKAKIGEAHKGRSFSPEHRAKIAATLRGRPAMRTPEGAARIAEAARKRMLSASNPGRWSAKRGPLSDITRAKISEARRGQRASAETRRKLSLSKRGKPKSPQHAARLAEHLKAYWQARRTSKAAS